MSDTKRPTLSIDVQHYQKYLDDSSISDKDKQELLETLWDIICELVQLGYGVHPLQNIDNECGESIEKQEDSTLLSADMVNSLHSTLREHFTQKANAESVLDDKEAEDENPE